VTHSPQRTGGLPGAGDLILGSSLTNNRLEMTDFTFSSRARPASVFVDAVSPTQFLYSASCVSNMVFAIQPNRSVKSSYMSPNGSAGGM